MGRRDNPYPELQIGENWQGARFSRAAPDRFALQDLERLALQDETQSNPD